MNRYIYPEFKRKKVFVEFQLNDRVRPTAEWYRSHDVIDKGFGGTIVKIDSNGYWLHWNDGIIGFADIFKKDQIEHE